MDGQLKSLVSAIKQNHYERFENMLQINPGLAHLRNEMGNTAINHAAQSPNSDFLLYLIRVGADINNMGNDRTPLITTVMNNNLANTKLLMESRANPTLASKNNGWTPLYIAANRGYSDIVAELLKSEYSPQNFINQTLINTIGDTALMVASMQGHLTIVQKLIENGAEVNINDNDNRCALMKAADKGHAEVIKTLIDAQADVNANWNMGYTALMLAVGNGHEEATQTLLATPNIEIDKQNVDKRTALFFAVNKKNIAIMKTLLSKGANLNIEDRNRKTAFLLARNNPETYWELMNFYQDEMMLNDPHKLLTIDALFNFYDSIDTSNPHYNDAQMRMFELLNSFEASDEAQKIELLEKKLCCAINSGKDSQLIDNLYNDLCGLPYSNELENTVTVNAIQGAEYWINMARTIKNKTMQTNNNESIKISQVPDGFFANESSRISTDSAENASVLNPGEYC